MQKIWWIPSFALVSALVVSTLVVDPDTVFNSLLVIEAIGAAIFVIYALLTWNRTNPATRVASICCLVLIAVWSQYVSDYWDRYNERPELALVNDPCSLDQEEPIRAKVDEPTALQGWVVDCGSGTEAVFASTR